MVRVTALTAGCWSLGSLLVVRFLFGAGEAGTYPNVARVIRKWFPTRERGRAQAVFMTFALVGGAFAPVVAAYLIGQLGWRAVFLVFGAVGWCGRPRSCGGSRTTRTSTRP